MRPPQTESAFIRLRQPKAVPTWAGRSVDLAGQIRGSGLAEVPQPSHGTGGTGDMGDTADRHTSAALHTATLLGHGGSPPAQAGQQRRRTRRAATLMPDSNLMSQ